ncbi:MAG: 50S ribosomal protein L21 [Chloroflexi bacterium]|nr:MAG: 50S ribosomal protein L21 [Chloroflexota bacterium]
MYAVVRSGSKSYRVEEGTQITVDRRKGDAGETVTFDQVLLVADGVRVRAGAPFVSDAKVTAEIVGHGRGPKIRVFKYKNKTRSRKTRGHRQDETTLKITKIEA